MMSYHSQNFTILRKYQQRYINKPFVKHICVMNEDFSLDILYANESVPEELYKLVQHGSCSQLDIRLRELSNRI